MEIVVFLTKGQEGDTLTKQGRRKGNSMRGLPDSAIVGTYGRMKHMKHKRRSSITFGDMSIYFLEHVGKKLEKKIIKLQNEYNLTKV